MQAARIMATATARYCRSSRPPNRRSDLATCSSGSPQPASIRPQLPVQAGRLCGVRPACVPAILGWDAAGIVDRVGSAVRDWNVGDAVMAMCDMTRPGAYAGLVAVDASHLARAPSSLPLPHAAAIPLAALTAWHALHDLAGAAEGQTVLIQMLPQVASARWPCSWPRRQVLACSPRPVPPTMRCCAAWAPTSDIDYHSSGWPTALAGSCDCVLDGAGGDTRTRSWSVLKRGGVLVAIAMPPVDPAEAAAHGCRAALAQVVPHGERLREIARLVDEGRLRVMIDSEFPLADVSAAHARSESRHAVGKILLTIEAGS